MNVLADQGFVGLALFLVLLVFIGLRATGVWRRLRSSERDEGAPPTARQRAQANRILLAAGTASIVAYIVQAAFNVQQVGLSFIFWLLAGLVTVVARTAGVPVTMNPRALVS